MPKLQIHPPTYPLSRDAFKLALTTGHGRALIHAENFNVSDYREEILEAATTCLVYDTQVDGFREWWLAQLCEAAGLIQTVINLPPDDSDRNREQRACLLKEFCLAGHSTALPQLYAMCRRLENSNDVEACSELIEVEGKKGLVFAARRLGEELLKDPDFWVSDWELWRFDDLYGDGCAKLILTEAALSDDAIRHYLQEAAAYEKEQSDAKQFLAPKELETVESVLQSINSATKRVGRLRRWGAKASQADREEVAKLLKTEFRTVVLVNALWCLSGTGLLVFDEALLRLVFHDDDDVRFLATQVFSHHGEEAVRLAGLALLERGDVHGGTELMRLSARTGDSGAILSSLPEIQTGDDRHGIFCNLVDLIEMNEAIREPLIPLYVYEFSPCMHCRERAIESLIKWEACPQWLIEEAAKDASADIRKLSESITSGK